MKSLPLLFLVLIVVIVVVASVSVIAPPPPPPPTPEGFGQASPTAKSTGTTQKTASSTPPPPATKLTVEERLSALEGRVETLEQNTSGISAPTWVLIVIDLVLVGLVLYVWKNLQPKEPGV